MAIRKLKRIRRAGSLVLVVDDYEDNREMYAEYFRFAGYRVDVASDGESALQKIRRRLPSVVLMDLEMPAIDGWAATRTIKSDPRTKHICVVVVTGHATKDAMTRAQEAGANSVVTKPILPSELVEVVRRCCAV